MTRSATFLVIAVIVAAFCCIAMPARAAMPEIAATSITAEGLTLVYGAGFSGDKVEVNVQDSPQLAADRGPRKAEESLASLERVLQGRAQLPVQPAEKDRYWRPVTEREENTLLCAAGKSTGSYPAVVRVLWVRNGTEISKPYVLNRPEVWGVSPFRARPGSQVIVWGANIGSEFVLVDAKGGMKFFEAYAGKHDHSHRPEIKFVRLLMLPEDIAPGDYRLYCWGGFGDLGWSAEPFNLHIGPAATAPKISLNARDFGAAGDGMTDDSTAITKAMKAAEAAGGGRVFLPAGRYLVSQPLDLPKGVFLSGQGKESTIIEANPWKRFGGSYPEGVFSRPPDYNAATYKPAYWGVDWMIAGLYKDKTYMAWLQSGGGLEDLTLDAGQVSHITSLVIIGDAAAGTVSRPFIRRCRLLSRRMGLYGEFPDDLNTAGILVTGGTEEMSIEQNDFSVSAQVINHLPGLTRYARICYNRFSVSDIHTGNLWVPRSQISCLVEGNVLENGARGKTEQTGALPQAIQRNLYIHNTFRNIRKGDGEILMYEAGSLSWYGKVVSAGADSLVCAATWRPSSAQAYLGGPEAGFRECIAVITQGRGLGQFRRIVSNTADTLKLDRPWTLPPDAGSVVGIMKGGVVENLHLGNEFFDCSHYTGVYGSGLRNVWVNEIHERVSGGTSLWPISGGRVMMFNLVYGSKYHERGGIVMQNGRAVPSTMKEEEKPGYLSLHKMVGNEVRSCSLEDRRYTSTENGQVWTNVMRSQWATKGTSDPFTPVPGNEAAISLWDEVRWANYPEDPALDPLPSSSRWNLFYENQIVRCPTGILVGKAVEKTVLGGNTFYETPRPVYDLGRGTIQIDNYVHQPPAAN